MKHAATEGETTPSTGPFIKQHKNHSIIVRLINIIQDVSPCITEEENYISNALNENIL